ncbi:hypothetical protein PAG33_21605, partial [Klebsiella quasipneumoniae]|nr:hypothetical protein [Klebsiella quasipneumoniae]
KIGPDPRNFNQRVSLGRNDLLIRTFLKSATETVPISIDEALLSILAEHVVSATVPVKSIVLFA